MNIQLHFPAATYRHYNIEEPLRAVLFRITVPVLLSIIVSLLPTSIRRSKEAGAAAAL